MKRNVLSLAAMAALLVFALVAAGCSSSASAAPQSSSQAAESSAESAEAAPEYRAVGDVSAGGAVIEFTNKAGKDISAIAVKATGDGEYPASLLDGDDAIANGETVELMCSKIPEADAGGADVELKRLADVSITLAGGAAYELHQVDVYDIVDATVRVEGDVAYLEYTTEDGESASTLESEKAIAEEAARAAAEAEAAAAAEAEAAAAAEAEAAAAAEASAYEYDSSYGGTATYVDDSAVGSGSEEACIDDIVLR